MSIHRIHLLDVPIDAVTQTQALDRIRVLLASAGQQHVVTPNNEMLVIAHRDASFRSVLQRAALNLPDSTGVVLMARLQGTPLPERVTGTDTMQRLCETLGPEHPVFLLGAMPGVAERVADVLRQRNSGLRIVGTFDGSPREEDAPAIIHKINDVKPVILFVAYGAPLQEMWIDRYVQHLPTVRVAMGVGGAFDFIAGIQKRAPGWMRAIGLEWAWRFIQEPSRWKRMWRAVVVFPVLCFFTRPRASAPPEPPPTFPRSSSV